MSDKTPTMRLLPQYGEPVKCEALNPIIIIDQRTMKVSIHIKNLFYHHNVSYELGPDIPTVVTLPLEKSALERQVEELQDHNSHLRARESQIFDDRNIAIARCERAIREACKLKEEIAALKAAAVIPPRWYIMIFGKWIPGSSKLKRMMWPGKAKSG